MKKSVLMFSLLSGTALMFPRLTIASGLLAHTLTYTPEPKPAFQFEQLDKAYKTAGVCFLGVGDCGGGQYTDCVCPAGVDEGPYGCAEYYPSPCSSVCKVAYSDNCHIRESVNVPYYCEKYWDDCPSKCEVAAADNCINRTAVSTPYGCESYYSDCSSKCQTAYGDNCRNRSDNSCPYGCQSYWGDCSSKCQTCYADNCRNKTAVSVPANAHCTSYYSDCSSKCSAWSCDSGYNQSGSSCYKSSSSDESSGGNCRGTTHSVKCNGQVFCCPFGVGCEGTAPQRGPNGKFSPVKCFQDMSMPNPQIRL